MVSWSIVLRRIFRPYSGLAGYMPLTDSQSLMGTGRESEVLCKTGVELQNYILGAQKELFAAYCVNTVI